VAKITWDFFARRRKTDLKDLVDRGVVRDYDTFVSHCQSLGVVPSTPQEFQAQFGSYLVNLPPPEPKPEPAPAPPVEEFLEPEFLEATILLSGVDDVPPTPEPEPKKKGFKRTRKKSNKTSGG
jgi:hypothetical protein